MSLNAALIEHAAPTLAGLKPASLFRVQPEGSDFGAQFLACKEELARRGLALTLLKGCRRTGAYLVYLYRRRGLEEVLAQPEHRAFLLEMGYTPWEDVRGCLRQLAARLCLEEDFPHEIGVFLGYPLEDIRGFMAHKGKNYTLCGCWKCYGDPREAARTFRAFQDCTRDYRRRFRRGATLAQLIVAA
ncbi:DUF3793 family protein [Pseudoflavonifractor phocaeensis]|uniref:DUF3793 family protein n=1 Tax=Pseudoflavonifractor phocaeensis TaxID=1870988 RepID=UPI00195D18E7|nr:DUF3793 family protein [Pseudoflavonifractor phocaeensis]MBM6926782.1 DUF3793 family protein [Pseudoflavonifractor phocaeensis]